MFKRSGHVAVDDRGRALQICLWDFSSVPMRAFHMTWLAFFICFFSWFSIAPLMKVVRDEFSLTKEQVGWCIIGSVSATIFVRMLVGRLCDLYGPRRVYSALLLAGSVPVMGIGLSHDFVSFLLFRVAIGAIGASFVITQYHTSLMFAPRCVGTANATTAGWGNLGGGVAQLVMPLVFGGFLLLTGSESLSWRLAMLVSGGLCAVMAVAYWCFTQDTPHGNSTASHAGGVAQASSNSFLSAISDRRVWALLALYGACFGIELTINNVAALYFVDYFREFQSMEPSRALAVAGTLAGLFGLMNIFARTLGGYVGDRFGAWFGLNGRVKWLFLSVFCEGLALMCFSQMKALPWAIATLIVFSIFVQMAEGATFAVVPFVNRKALGAVCGLVGAGGNLGAVLAGFLFKMATISWPAALFLLGMLVTAVSFVSFAVKLSDEPVSAADQVSTGAQAATTAPLPA
ncbi:MAG: MFS transporter [Pirellulaceae bacterium]|nr:MAG: MFS transporter [Pirellulaceae bacterium]